MASAGNQSNSVIPVIGLVVVLTVAAGALLRRRSGGLEPVSRPLWMYYVAASVMLTLGIVNTVTTGGLGWLVFGGAIALWEVWIGYRRRSQQPG